MNDMADHDADMDDGEDEEVVFKGSAICQHLLDVGYTDFEQNTYTSPTSHENTQADTSSTCKGKTGWLHGEFKWFIFFPHHLFGTAAKLVECYMYTSMAKTVSSSKVVSEDDWLVLEHFLPQGDELRVSANTTFPWHSILRCSDAVVTVTCLLVLWIAMKDVFIMFGIVIAAFIIFGLYCMYWVQKLSSLKRLVLSLKEMNHLTSKTVRLLMEMDLISKGFVLAQGPGAPLDSLYEESPQMSCLRQALLHTLKSAANVLVSAHSTLEHRVCHHPVITQLFDEPTDLQHDWTLSQQMQYIKSRVTVIKLQSSAVLTELLLWLHETQISEFNVVFNSITTSYKEDALIDNMQSLKKQYEYNKCFWLTERPIITSQGVEEKKKNVYLAVHSLGLHLQAALVRVQSLESKFERESDTSTLSNPESLETFPSYEQFKTQITALRQELDSCQGCIEEAEIRAERKYDVTDKSIEPKTDQDTTDENEDLELYNVTKPLNVLLYDHQVTPAQDEVFEAYVDHNLTHEETTELKDDLWCADVRKERRMVRQQKAQGKRVLRELQPILTNRRKMWEEREKVALEKHITQGEQNAVQIIGSKEQLSEEKYKSTNDENLIESVNIEEIIIPELRNTVTCGLETPIQSSVAAIVEDEVDSDEERLRTYRKIKLELDEDEELRNAKEVKVKASEELEFCSGDEERSRFSPYEEKTKAEEETYMHNENINDEESCKIDWSTFTLPTRHTDTLDNRLHLYSGSSCLGFQAEVAAEARAASINFWVAKKQPEETFGGTGEGEIFGTDTDTEDEK